MLEIRHNAKQVVVPVNITGFGYQNGIRIDSNAIASVYGKDYSIAKILHDAIQEESNGQFRLYYLNEKKAAALYQGSKVTMPKMPDTSDGFVSSIRDANSPVKLKIKDVTVYLNVGVARNDASNHIYDITQKLRDTAQPVAVGRLSKSFALRSGISDKSIYNASENANESFSRETDATNDSDARYSVSGGAPRMRRFTVWDKRAPIF